MGMPGGQQYLMSVTVMSIADVGIVTDGIATASLQAHLFTSESMFNSKSGVFLEHYNTFLRHLPFLMASNTYIGLGGNQT